MIRVRKTYSILAIALTASACGGTASTIPSSSDQKSAQTSESSESTPETSDKSDPPNESPPPASNPPAAPPADTSHTTTPPPPACDRSALNQELSMTPLGDAVTNAAHFRCLCDDQGYPLVGNINAKEATASAFCKALRESGHL